MFRNCGLPGESHICRDVSWDLEGTRWGAKPRKALPLPTVSWATVSLPEREVSSENLSVEPPQGTMWECSPCPCGTSHSLICVPLLQRSSSRSVKPRRAAATVAPAWHSIVSAMAPTTAGTAQMRTQRNAVSPPGPGEEPVVGLRVCLGGAKLCSGLAGVPPQFCPMLGGQDDPEGLQRGGISLAHCRDLPVQEKAGTPASGSLLSLLLTENFTHCSFDHDLCGWEEVARPPVWSRNTSLNLGTSYGIPTRDHSNNSRAGMW